MAERRKGGGSERVWVEGSAGMLEGLWLPAGDVVVDRAVVLCHPHPLHGGTMETKLVARVARALGESGFQTLRFNFRGVGRSDGEWDGGRGERGDARAALDYVAARRPEAGLAVFGFSFGALVGLDVGGGDSRVSALVGVAPPVGHPYGEALGEPSKPTLIIGAGRDQIVDPGALERWVSGLAPAPEFDSIAEADHLFTGLTEPVAERVVEFLGRVMPSRTRA